MIGGSRAGQDDAPPPDRQVLTTPSCTLDPHPITHLFTGDTEASMDAMRDVTDTGQTVHTTMSKGDHSGSMLHSCTLDSHTTTHMLTEVAA